MTSTAQRLLYMAIEEARADPELAEKIPPSPEWTLAAAGSATYTSLLAKGWRPISRISDDGDRETLHLLARTQEAQP